MKRLVIFLTILLTSYRVISQENVDDSIILGRKRKEAFQFYNDSYKRVTNKEVYIQNIRQPEVKQVIIKNIYYTNRNNYTIFDYGYFGSYYRPNNYVIPIYHFGVHHRRHHR